MGACAEKGSEEIHKLLKRPLKERGLAKLKVRACTSSCLDVCWNGPSVSVQPDGYFYGPVTLEDIPEIVAAFEKGERVARLVLAGNDFIDPKMLARQKKRDQAGV